MCLQALYGQIFSQVEDIQKEHICHKLDLAECETVTANLPSLSW